MRIAVFGAGYVGLVTGACFADLGHEVVVRDIIADKIDALRRGEVPIHEEGLLELLEQNRERLLFTTDVAEAIDGTEVVYVAVGTPPTHSGLQPPHGLSAPSSTKPSQSSSSPSQASSPGVTAPSHAPQRPVGQRWRPARQSPTPSVCGSAG